MIKVNGKEVQFETFPNGETRLVKESIIHDLSLMFPKISFKYENDSDLIKLMFVKEYLDSYQAVSNTYLTIYYMPYSRMDRSENGSPFTLKYVTKFINGLGFNHVTVIEPHSDVTCALLDNVKAEYVTLDLLPKVLDEIGFDRYADYLVFPDVGATKRYKNIGSYCTLVGHKERDFETGKIQGLELIGINNHVGEKALILDDLSSYGGTFVATAKELRKMGVKEIYLLVAHAENSIFKGELFEHIDGLFTTDSILTEQNYFQNVKYKPQLKIYNIEDILEGKF